MSTRQDVDTQRLVTVYNDSGEDVPPFGVMRLSGLNDEGLIKIDKPDADSTIDVVFNGPGVLEAEGVGTAYVVNGPLRVVTHDSDDAPVAGDEFGTEVDGWYLRKGNFGFRILGAIDGYDRIAVAEVVNGTNSSNVEIIETQAVTTPPTGYTDAKIVIWDVDTDAFIDGDDVWLIDANGV